MAVNRQRLLDRIQRTDRGHALNREPPAGADLAEGSVACRGRRDPSHRSTGQPEDRVVGDRTQDLDPGLVAVELRGNRPNHLERRVPINRHTRSLSPRLLLGVEVGVGAVGVHGEA
jgi:hypothetical protein